MCLEAFHARTVREASETPTDPAHDGRPSLNSYSLLASQQAGIATLEQSGSVLKVEFSFCRLQPGLILSAKLVFLNNPQYIPRGQLWHAL